MKCPVCQAKLLPVDGEMFCLQCGETVHKTEATTETVRFEETSDPLLKRAISDATDGEVKFSDGQAVPESRVLVHLAVSKNKGNHTFSSIRSILAPPRPIATNGIMLVPQPQGPTTLDNYETAKNKQTTTEALEKTVNDRSIIKAWAIGLIGLLAFVGSNLAVGSYFADRIYPGIKVGNISVGGWTFEQLQQKLPTKLSHPSLTAMVGSQRYEVNTADMGSINYSQLESNLKAIDRNTSLPIGGLFDSLFSQPVQPIYDVNASALAKNSEILSALVYRQPSDATPIILGSTATIIADKPGAILDPKAISEIMRVAYGRAVTVTLLPKTVTAKVTVASYTNDLTEAQTIMGLAINITVNKVNYAPTPERIGGWLQFNAPGRGVAINAAEVAAYVATIPGAFDRIGTVNSLMTALSSRQASNISPSIKEITPNPNPQPVVSANIPTIYTYCVDQTDNSLVSLSQEAEVNLGSGGWTMGGRLKFVRAVKGCNFMLSLKNPTEMGILDPACVKQTTCRIHNDLAISKSAWANYPSGWLGNIESYRTELINHVVGQWLGYSHPQCNEVTTTTPVLAMPSIRIPGCSPNWYAVPPELQDTKVLSGF